jgi:hypothetical protein
MTDHFLSRGYARFCLGFDSVPALRRAPLARLPSTSPTNGAEQPPALIACVCDPDPALLHKLLRLLASEFHGQLTILLTPLSVAQVVTTLSPKIARARYSKNRWRPSCGGMAWLRVLLLGAHPTLNRKGSSSKLFKSKACRCRERRDCGGFCGDGTAVCRGEHGWARRPGFFFLCARQGRHSSIARD